MVTDGDFRRVNKVTVLMLLRNMVLACGRHNKSTAQAAAQPSHTALDASIDMGGADGLYCHTFLTVMRADLRTGIRE